MKQLLVRVWPEGAGFVAECVELKVVSQGGTEQEAVANLREAVELFLETADKSEVHERLPPDAFVRTFEVAG